MSNKASKSSLSALEQHVEAITKASNLLGWPGPRPSQKEVLEPIFAGKNVLAVLPTSAGKCLGQGTPVLMFDGSVVPVEDVRAGDLLMGPDSRPRRVLGTTHGIGPLFRVIPQRGDSYVVNEHHVLSLQKTPQRKKSLYPCQRGGTVVNVDVHTWLSSSKWFRHIHKGWRTGVEFAEQDIHQDLPPYLLGLWLGDGSSRRPSITTADPEVVQYIYAYADGIDMNVSVEEKPGNLASTYSVVGISGRWEHCGSRFTKALRTFDLINNKHIPVSYLINSRKYRLELLAGLIDSDGHLPHDRNCVDMIFVNEQLAADATFLLRSLGFYATMTPCKKTCVDNGVEGDYFRIYGSGDFSVVPVKIARKQRSCVPPRTDPLRVGIKVEPIGDGRYYGFELDGDHLFLLGDFTVTHNSGIFQIPTLAREGLTIVLSPLVALMADQVDRLRQHGIEAYQLNSHCSTMERKRAIDAVQSGVAKLLYVSPERLQGITPEFFGKSTIQMIAVDEAHCISEWGHDFRPSYLRIGRQLKRMGMFQTIALTATATPQVIDEICSVLDLGDDVVRIIKTPDRPNISYGVAGSKYSVSSMVEIGGLPCLVYGSTRMSVEEAAVGLRRAGYNAKHYHAGMTKDDRMAVQDDFISGRVDVICATCAFGMGIDHPGIRSVVHLEMPSSLEAYMQESGRAGRDGSQSIAICRATLDTLGVARGLVSLSWPTPGTVYEVWNRLQPLFQGRPGKWEGDGKIQLTNKEIAEKIGTNEREVGSCLRILHDCGAIRRVPYQDRPVVVKILSSASSLQGRRQKLVVRRLQEHADASGEVQGSVAFMWNVIGLDRAYASELNARNAIRFTWVERCQLIEKIMDGTPPLDEDQIHRIRRRSLARIDYSAGFLKNSVSCRRQYLLEYFGDMSGGEAMGMCCDLCKQRGSRPTAGPSLVS